VSEPNNRTGLWFAFGAYGLWGALPLFWKLLRHVPAGEQLLHRVVWAGVTMAGLLFLRGRLAELRPVLADPGRRRRLALSAVLLGINWFTFLLAIETDRVLHASLGYYLNPIVSVVLGMVVLGERLRRLQWAAVVFAVGGVIVLLWHAGEFPWIGLVLAGAFGCYGLLRKTIEVEPLPGSTIEAGMLGIPCVLAMVWLAFSGTSHFAGPDLNTTALLLAAGPITAVPLLWFTIAARRLPMFALGFMQYITPTSHFLLAVFVFGEVFTGAHAVAFVAIWCGVALFALDLALQRGRPS
jgi:chloramphenicol-sensitive protein RarD